MEVREYITIRRANNIIRQRASAKERLTFEELSVLALLGASDDPLPTSAIADWQHALRPTMTHRANHLASLGLIKRAEGSVDRRNVVCSITEKGQEVLDEVCIQIRKLLTSGKVLTRIDPDRVKQYLIAMGQHYLQASELVLVGLSVCGVEGVPITQLVGALGLLQPTVSMSVQSLEECGLVVRDVPGSKAVRFYLTDQGRIRAEELTVMIENLIVRRKPRTSA